MARCGTSSRPRVADIVAAAGVSNDAFYRHFASKDALVTAILDDGTERLRSYLAHQMDKESTPEGQIRRWVQGVLAQAADDDIAASTLAVLWNAGNLGQALASPPPVGHRPARLTPARTVRRARQCRPRARRVAGRPRDRGPPGRPPLAAHPADPRRDRPRRRVLPGGGRPLTQRSRWRTWATIRPHRRRWTLRAATAGRPTARRPSARFGGRLDSMPSSRRASPNSKRSSLERNSPSSKSAARWG